ncbi:MAG: low molecular weight protein-tyrosine-phosphatase [Planctomycetota bacterium]
MPETASVLFVCLGNICRSPLAEGVFLHLARERGVAERFQVDSAGTEGWHSGEPADPRSIAVARRHGVDLPSRARKVTPDDLDRFDLVVVMDGSNRDDLVALGADPSRVRLLRAWDPEAEPGDEVPDPYYGGDDGFDLVYAMCDRACRGLLAATAP